MIIRRIINKIFKDVILKSSLNSQYVDYTKERIEFNKFIPKEGLGENIGRLVVVVLQTHGSIFNQVSNEVTLNVNMLGSLMEEWISAKFLHHLIAAK